MALSAMNDPQAGRVRVSCTRRVLVGFEWRVHGHAIESESAGNVHLQNAQCCARRGLVARWVPASQAQHVMKFSACRLILPVVGDRAQADGELPRGAGGSVQGLPRECTVLQQWDDKKTLLRVGRRRQERRPGCVRRVGAVALVDGGDGPPK